MILEYFAKKSKTMIMSGILTRQAMYTTPHLIRHHLAPTVHMTDVMLATTTCTKSFTEIFFFKFIITKFWLFAKNETVDFEAKSLNG